MLKEYFLSNIEVFVKYCRKGVLPVIFIAAAVYITAVEKVKWKKMILGILPLLVTAAFFIPLTRVVFEIMTDEEGTYYRILWLLPMGIDIAYGACLFFDRHRRLGLCFTCATVMAMSGFSLVYKDTAIIKKAENRFHIPNSVIEICNMIMPAENEGRVRAAFPPELVYFVRQYDTNIMMPYGRDYVEAQWNWWNAVCAQMNVTPEHGYIMEELLQATRETKCRYLILNRSIPCDREPEELGLTLYGQTPEYSVYLDRTVKN
jgi:hypothetical protein